MCLRQSDDPLNLVFRRLKCYFLALLIRSQSDSSYVTTSFRTELKNYKKKTTKDEKQQTIESLIKPRKQAVLYRREKLENILKKIAETSGRNVARF